MSNKDVDLAALCDSIADDFGEIKEAVGEKTVCELQDLTSRTVSASADCCVPKNR